MRASHDASSQLFGSAHHDKWRYSVDIYIYVINIFYMDMYIYMFICICCSMYTIIDHLQGLVALARLKNLW